MTRESQSVMNLEDTIGMNLMGGASKDGQIPQNGIDGGTSSYNCNDEDRCHCIAMDWAILIRPFP